MHQETVEELFNGRAQICREPEIESYFDIYGEPEGYENAKGERVTPEQEREDIIDLIDRDGLWIYFAQVECKCCGQWKTVDSLGGIIGSLDDSGYHDDFLRAIEENL